MRKLQVLVDVRVLLQLMRMLRRVVDASPPRHSAMDLRFSSSGYSLVSLKAPSGTLGLGTSAGGGCF